MGQKHAKPPTSYKASKAIGVARLFLGKALFAYVGVALLLVALLSTRGDFAFSCKKSFASSNAVYLLVAIFVGVTVAVLFRLGGRAFSNTPFRTDKGFRIVVLIGGIVLLCVQAGIVLGGWFHTGWDVKGVTDFGNEAGHWRYYSTYPNQLFMAGLFDIITDAGALFGFGNGYLCVVSVGCACVTSSICMAAFVAKRLLGYTGGYAALAVGFILPGLSPWVLVPYSDTYGMLFVMLVLCSYVCLDTSPARWFCVFFFGIVGYAVKPTSVFILVAVMMSEVMDCLVVRGSFGFTGDGAGDRAETIAGRPGKGSAMPTVKGALASIAAVLFAVSLVALVRADGDWLDDELAFSPSHYLMMGFNFDTGGCYSQDDVDFSQSFDTRDSRVGANLIVFGERVEHAGVSGVAILMAKKTLTNYADGTFAWECEGEFYKDTNGKSDFVKDWYGIDEVQSDGEVRPREARFSPYAQVVWLSLLLGVFMCLFIPGKRLSKQIIAISLAILMLSVFVLLFECRARYLFLYSPCFVILACAGYLNGRFPRKRVGEGDASSGGMPCRTAQMDEYGKISTIQDGLEGDSMDLFVSPGNRLLQRMPNCCGFDAGKAGSVVSPELADAVLRRVRVRLALAMGIRWLRFEEAK